MPRLPPGVGGGVAAALVLLMLLNLLLLSDEVIHRFGAVFAVGRAMDKQLYVETYPPEILVLGNSRVDNGIDPHTLTRIWGSKVSAFNLGIPGANVRVTYGMVKRLESTGALQRSKIRGVILGLDESYLQADETLGYIYFFGHRPTLWARHDYRLWFGSWVRLWSYSDNLRELREPEKALRFIAATFQQVEPVGGAAWRHLGYRAGFGGAQNEAQITSQRTLSAKQPDPNMVRYFEELLELFRSHGIQVAVVFPPLLDRKSAYLDPHQANGSYDMLRGSLQQHPDIRLVSADPVPRDPAYFVNPGHLNDTGAQIYSAWLAERLRLEWPWLKKGVRSDF